jgi:transcriptional regulator with XRE-family HTH domain/desulfoferrodoxin (superoxide reductase-like protein)
MDMMIGTNRFFKRNNTKWMKLYGAFIECLHRIIYDIWMEERSVDSNKMGMLLLRLRKEKGLTQNQLAKQMNISDKTISKWERGMGYPDISFLEVLSQIFHVDIDNILSGELESNSTQSGNLKKVKFFACPHCGNIIYNTGNADISCCGRKLSELTAKPIDKLHMATIEDAGDEYYITFHHEMSKNHFISFVAYATYDKILFLKLYPEQEAAVRLPKLLGGSISKPGGNLYCYCSQHGLWLL